MCDGTKFWGSGASVYLKRKGLTPLHEVKSIEMAKLLLRFGADIKATCGEDTEIEYIKGHTVLHSLVESRATSELISFLIEKGVGRNKQ